MKMLVIDNSAMNCDKNGNFYTNITNGAFIKDLIECGNELTWYQFAVENLKGISGYNLKENNVKCVPIKRTSNKLFSYIKVFLRIIPEIRKADFVYFFYPGSLTLGTFLCRLFRKKYGLYIRGMQGFDSKRSHCIYKKAHTIFTVSKFFTDRVNEVVGKEVAHSIRPMIPFNEDDIVKDRTYLKKRIYNLLYLGRIEKDKGIIELLNAIKALADSKEFTISLKIVGGGNFLEGAKQLCHDLKIDEHVSFEGVVYDDTIKREYYLEADAYILPTYHEGFPRTLYEAMIFGTPIITTFVGGIPALMKDGVNCLKIETRSVDSIVEKIKQFLTNYEQTATTICSTASETIEPIISKKRLTHGKDLNKILKNAE